MISGILHVSHSLWQKNKKLAVFCECHKLIYSNLINTTLDCKAWKCVETSTLPSRSLSCQKTTTRCHQLALTRVRQEVCVLCVWESVTVTWSKKSHRFCSKTFECFGNTIVRGVSDRVILKTNLNFVTIRIKHIWSRWVWCMFLCLMLRVYV